MKRYLITDDNPLKPWYLISPSGVWKIYFFGIWPIWIIEGDNELQRYRRGPDRWDINSVGGKRNILS